MSIMELGAIGELVGGVAVIGSLLYVGLQVRQSNRQAEQRNEIERNESERQFASDNTTMLLAMTDPQLTPIFRKGLSDFGALSHDEQLRFDMFLLFWVSLIRTTGGAAWWAATKARYAPEFREFVDQLRMDSEAPR